MIFKPITRCLWEREKGAEGSRGGRTPPSSEGILPITASLAFKLSNNRHPDQWSARSKSRRPMRRERGRYWSRRSAGGGVNRGCCVGCRLWSPVASANFAWRTEGKEREIGAFERLFGTRWADLATRWDTINFVRKKRTKLCPSTCKSARVITRFLILFYLYLFYTKAIFLAFLQVLRNF